MSPQPARWPQDHVLRYFDYPGESGFIARKVRYDESLTGRKASGFTRRTVGAHGSRARL